MEGVTYVKGKVGVNRAFIESSAGATQAVLDAALKNLPNVHELVCGAISATSPNPMPVAPATPNAAPNAAPNAGPAPDAAAGGDAEGAGPARLDLATLYTMRGLFRGSARMPIPSNLDGQLYVPAGAAGIAMANFAARMGLETTGITLPLATPVTSAAVRDVRTKAVVAAGSDLSKEAENKLREEDTAAAQSESTLAPGVGELRIVDRAFGRQPAVRVRGDDAGEAAALGLAAGHLPNLWETGKQNLSIEEIRYDVHRFFSLRSSSGQAAVAMYRLDKWAEGIKGARNVVSNVEAKVYVDVADPGLKDVVRTELQKLLGVSEVKVETGSLHAGTQCCDKLPALHYREPGYAFHQGAPAFQEDIVIPWEGTRLITAVKGALPKLKAGELVKLVARVSEGPEMRLRLKKQIEEMLPKSSHVTVLCAYKQGVSWLMDEIAPQLKGEACRVDEDRV